MHVKDTCPNMKGPGAKASVTPRALSSDTPARKPPLANGTQAQERRIFSQQRIANPDSLHFDSHTPRIHPAGHLNRPWQSISPLTLVTTQPSPHPAPSASILFNDTKPPFVRRNTPARGMLHDPEKRNADKKNPKNVALNTDGTREWSSDLCMFCDHNLGTCLAALVCPCIVYAQNKARLEHLNLTETPLNAWHPQIIGDGDSHSDTDRVPQRVNRLSRWATQDCAIHACLTAFCLSGWVMQVSSII
ncbi:hypothetical protein D9619_011318 [Psilocybe cf. subviscida]|uniref:Uncharacterized protein n=1 Tax=Psilocybe cf. subviscida TaxID=2480587 RepID=A0A8H5BKS6_9AGAR|nr:hypothetical protein D9619_011318 [Psilocybe cf. subviscida]